MSMNSNDPKILIVDDDNKILKLLKKFLSQNGFLVSTAIDVKEAEIALKECSFDLIILDVMLPEVTGLDFAKKIKSNGNVMPIIMLTALSEPDDRIKGLESGANDYLSKPFNPRELLLRIKNLIDTHNNHKKSSKVKYFGDNSYDFFSKEFIKKGAYVKLTSNERKLLEILINHEGIAISREEILKKIGVFLSLRSIDVQIARIRNKIEDNPKNPKFLKSIRNEGYAFYS